MFAPFRAHKPGHEKHHGCLSLILGHHQDPAGYCFLRQKPSTVENLQFRVIVELDY